MSSKKNQSNVPPHVLNARAQMSPEEAAFANQFTPEILESLTPDRMVTMDFTEIQLKQRAQADGSDEALREADFICERLAVLAQAHMQFSLRPMLFQESNLNFERLYHTLYQDILEHEDVWFTKVYPLEPKYSERCIGILGTLATILRQRGQVDECIAILELDTKVLKFYQDASAQPNTPPGQINCCRVLTFKYHQIMANAHAQKQHKELAVESFKKCVEYELQENFTFEQQNWAFILPKFFGINERRQLELVSDDQIYETLQTMHNVYAAATPKPKGDIGEHVALRKCAQCGKQEEKRGDHKICAKCKGPPYCSRRCQKTHWQAHKKTCCKK